ncbi:unnamed protein product [Alopecurus aequalis]
MVEVDWASLPPDLIRHVADCLLATNDIDYYIDMRGVCCNWRAAMADPCRPGADSNLLVFHPRQWIMLDEHSKDEHRLFFNVSTGRFLRRRLPLPWGHLVVRASDGLVILGQIKRPHAACVLNPFTGSLIRFAVSIRPEHIRMNAVTCSEPMLVVYSWVNRTLRCADPTSSNFISVQLSHPGQYKVQSMVSYAGHVYVANMEGSVFKIVGTAQHCYGELIAQIPSCELTANIPNKSTFFLVESSGDLLLIQDSHRGIFQIFRVDVERNRLQAVKSIGSRALFLGPRSLSVDAKNLPSIHSDCLYYNCKSGMYIYDLKDGTESTICSLYVALTFKIRPKSLDEVLLLYCMLGPNLKWTR